MKNYAKTILVLISMIITCYTANATFHDVYQINETCVSLITPGYWDYVNDFTATISPSYPGIPICRLGANPTYSSYFWSKQKYSLLNYSSSNDSLILEFSAMFNGGATVYLPSLSQCYIHSITPACETFLVKVSGTDDLYVVTSNNVTRVGSAIISIGPVYNFKIIANDSCETSLYLNSTLLYNHLNCSLYNDSWYVSGFTGTTGWDTLYIDNLTLRNLYNYNSNTNICLYDETNNSLIDKTVYVDVITESFNQNYNGSNGCVSFNLTSSDDYEFRYRAGNYTERSYYATINYTSLYNFSFYSLHNSTGYNPIIISVFDQSSTRVQKAQINVLRYFPNDAAQYKLVSMKRTNNYGEASLDLELFNPYYKFRVLYNDEYKIFDGPTQVFSTTWNYFISTITERFDSFNRINNILYALDFLNTTNQFRLEYTDVDGLVQEVCLNVIRFTNYSYESYCHNCTGAVSAILYCNVANISGTSYIGRFELKTTTQNSNYSSIADKIVSFKDSITVFEKNDLFYGILFLITGALLGISIGGVGMLLMAFYFGIFILSIVDIINLTLTSIIAVFVGILIMIIIFKRRFPG